jgi:pSer/pThr/pTyr-binding forkhead associated (FHA) protein
MVSLTLRFEHSVSKEFGVEATVTIGRLPDNSIVIDHPSVSSHHACVFRDGADVVLEDLQSTNGTFVNDRRVSRCKLQHGDVVRVGTHKLVFNDLAHGPADRPESQPIVTSQGETAFVDDQKHQRLMTILMNAEARAANGDTDTPATVGVLRVLAGNADCSEYILEGHTSLIGRAKWSLVRLKGWFTPNVSVAITRNRHGYVATRFAGKVLINNQPINGRYDLKNGDILCVAGLTLEFRLEQAIAEGDRVKDRSASAEIRREVEISNTKPSSEALA